MMSSFVMSLKKERMLITIIILTMKSLPTISHIQTPHLINGLKVSGYTWPLINWYTLRLEWILLSAIRISWPDLSG